MKQKPFKSLDEQIEILKSRGLKIPDENFAKEFLLKNNYYRVSGYSLTLRTNDIFHENTTFQDIVDIYNFDYELRHILSKYLEIIEVNVKSVYAYEFSKVYGATGYLNSKNFTDSFKNKEIHKKIISKIKEQIKKSLPHELYLKHFIEELKTSLPLWVAVDLMTISDISHIFFISKSEIQNEVVKQILNFNLEFIKHNSSKLLAKFLHSMTIIRNFCAHGSRLYNRIFQQKASLNKQEFALLRTKPDGTKDNERLFGFILIMKRLLLNDDFINFKQELVALKTKLPRVNTGCYGFPDGWQNLI